MQKDLHTDVHRCIGQRQIIGLGQQQTGYKTLRCNPYSSLTSFEANINATSRHYAQSIFG